MNEGQVQIHVGESLEAVGARFVDSWHRMERGEAVNEKHIGFADRETMVRVLSPKRLGLLRHVHQHPAKNISALAQALGRDDHRVHEDVEALIAAGLLDRHASGLHAEYEAVRMQTRIAL